MAITTFNGPVASQNGFILPSFTAEEILAIPNPTAGLMVFNSTAATTAYYDGTEWVGAAPPVTSVTYTANVDWDPGMTSVQWSGMAQSLSSNGFPWINSTGFALMIAQPVGTVYTCTVSGGPTGATATTTGTWSGGGGSDFVNCFGANGFEGMASYTLESITFTPAA